MSTVTDPGTSREPLPLRGGGRPLLTLVPRPSVRAPRIPFVLLVVTVLTGGLVGLLLLNTALQRGAFVTADLRERATLLQEHQQDLEVRVAALQEPQRVAQAAVQLGMVRNTSTAFLSLADGALLGTPQPGAAGDRPLVEGPATPGLGERGKRVAEAGPDLASLHAMVAVPAAPADRKSEHPGERAE